MTALANFMWTVEGVFRLAGFAIFVLVWLFIGCLYLWFKWQERREARKNRR